MKVAIITDLLIKLGGAERVVKCLKEMYPGADIFTLVYDEKKVGHIFKKEDVIQSSIDNWPSFLKKRYKYFFPLFPLLVEKFDLSEYDLVISSSSAYSHGVITNLETKHVVYCHSPMRYAWDYTHKYMQEQNAGSVLKGVARYFINRVRQWDFIASKRADLFIANSKHVQKRIKKFYRRDSEVIYPPVQTDRFEARDSKEDYFLVVSTLTPYKKIDLAIELFNKINKRLVIIGDGPARRELEEMAGDTIDFLGFEEDDVIAEYMSNAKAFIFPGEEDFGIAPIEAMASGTPVLAYKKGGLTETVKEGETGEFFEEQTVDSMEDALGRLLLNYKFYKPKDIAKHAATFSEERFKSEFKKVVKKLI